MILSCGLQCYQYYIGLHYWQIMTHPVCFNSKTQTQTWTRTQTQTHSSVYPALYGLTDARTGLSTNLPHLDIQFDSKLYFDECFSGDTITLSI